MTGNSNRGIELKEPETSPGLEKSVVFSTNKLWTVYTERAVFALARNLEVSTIQTAKFRRAAQLGTVPAHNEYLLNKTGEQKYLLIVFRNGLG